MRGATRRQAGAPRSRLPSGPNERRSYPGLRLAGSLRSLGGDVADQADDFTDAVRRGGCSLDRLRQFDKTARNGADYKIYEKQLIARFPSTD